MSGRKSGSEMLVAGLLFGAFGAAFALGRAVTPLSRTATEAHAELEQETPETVPAVFAEKRYLVPVSISQPNIGPESALVTVVEWCDLTGEKCRASADLLRRLREEYGPRVRHVWRHYPTENSENARDMHEVAHAAFENAGKFWELRDALLTHDRAPHRLELKALAARVGLDWSIAERSLERHGHAGYVAADSMFAAKFGVSEVPALFVNGRRVQGLHAYEDLKRVVAEELAHAERVVAAGVPPEKVYGEITRDADWGNKADTASLAGVH